MGLCHALMTFLSVNSYEREGGLFVVEFNCINFPFCFVEIGEVFGVGEWFWNVLGFGTEYGVELGRCCEMGGSKWGNSGLEG